MMSDNQARDDASVECQNSMGAQRGTEANTASLHRLLLQMEEDEMDNANIQRLSEMLNVMTKDQINRRREDTDQTALHIAAERGLASAAGNLLDFGADIEAKTSKGDSPLCIACERGKRDVVDLLLRRNANANALNHDEWPVFSVAVWQNHPAVVDVFLTRQVGLDWTVKDWGSPLTTAIRNDKVEIMKMLIGNDWSRAILLNKPCPKDLFRTPLGVAALLNHLEAARILLEANADPNAPGYYGRPPLFTACELNNIGIAWLLLQKKGVKVNARDSHSRTALDFPCKQGYSDIVKLLLEHGADPDNSSNCSLYCCGPPLYVASTVDVVELLLEKGADLAARGKLGQTALHSAAIRSDKDSFNVLFRKMESKDIFIEDKNGRTALCVAFDNGLLETITNSLFEKLKAAQDECTHDALEHEALVWAAKDSKRHPIVQSIFIENAKRIGTHAFDHVNRWSSIEWAAHKELPDVLWFLIAKSTRTTRCEEDVILALQLLQSPESAIRAPKELAQPRTTRRPSQKMDGNNRTNFDYDTAINLTVPNSEDAEFSKRLRRAICMDILAHPPFATIYTDYRTFEPIKLEKTFSQTLHDFEVSVIQFYKKRGSSRTLQQFLSIECGIYDFELGPKKIMETAVGIIKEIKGRMPDVMRDSIWQDYVIAKPKFTWVHLPATNMDWMNDLVKRMMKDDNYTMDQFREVSAFLRDSWVQIPDSTSKSRIMRPRFIVRNLKKENDAEVKMSNKSGGDLAESNSKNGKDSGKDDENDKMGTDHDQSNKHEEGPHIPMPFLSLSIQRKKYETENENDQSPKEDDKSPFLKSLQDAKAKYDKLMKMYDSSVIHGSSTLDESYYHFNEDSHSQEDKKTRNESQVITKSLVNLMKKLAYPKTSSIETDNKSLVDAIDDLGYWPLIRVNQLWVWVIDNKWLISATTYPIDEDEKATLTRILDHLKNRAAAAGSDSQPGSAAEMSRLLVDYFISFYETAQSIRHHRNGPNDRTEDGESENLDKESTVSIRQIFSNSMNKIAIDEANLFERFSKDMDRWRAQIAGKLEHQDPAKSDQKIQEAAREARELLSSIKDIRDELNILKSTAIHQQTVQQGLSQSTKNTGNDTATYVVKDIIEMDKVAERIQSAVHTTLSLQQSEVANLQAVLSVQQGQEAVKQGQEAVKQGKTLMVFTVVTIIFAPLSFLPALFALDVASFQQAPSWALWIIFGVPLFAFAPLAFSFVYWETLKKWIQNDSIVALITGKHDNASFSSTHRAKSKRLSDADTRIALTGPEWPAEQMCDGTTNNETTFYTMKAVTNDGSQATKRHFGELFKRRREKIEHEV